MVQNEITDYLAVNSARVAGIMRSKNCTARAEEFRSTTVRLSGFWRLAGFMLRSILLRMPGKKTIGDVIEFREPSQVTIQAEGEYQKLEDVEKIEVKKSKKALKVVRF